MNSSLFPGSEKRVQFVIGSITPFGSFFECEVPRMLCFQKSTNSLKKYGGNVISEEKVEKRKKRKRKGGCWRLGKAGETRISLEVPV